MKFSNLGTAFGLILFTTTTFASEVSYKNEAPLLQHTWQGLYGGFNLGAVNHTMDITDVNAAAFLATIQQISNPKFSGGLQLGYRHESEISYIKSIYGLEISANFSDAKFKKTYGSNFATYELSSQHELKTTCLLELIGGLATQKTFLFLAAGISWVNIAGTTQNLDSIAFFDSFNVNKKQWGTALGAGIEYALWNRLSARLKVDVIMPYTYTTSDNVDNNYQISNQIVQGTVGINYKFL